MEAVLDDLSLPALAAATRANFFAFKTYLGRSPGADYRAGPPLTWMLTGLPATVMNLVFVEDMIADEADQAIADVLAYIRSRHIKQTGWWLRPGVELPWLDSVLAAHGVVHHENNSGMAADLHALNEAVTPPAGVTVEPVTCEKALRCFAQTVLEGFEVSAGFELQMYELYRGLGFELPLRSYLGCLDGRPVATSQLFLGAGVAGVYLVATVPAARRQGIGASMTLAALRDAKDLGYRVAVLQASPSGFRVYERLGFQEVCRMNHWEWHATTQ